MIQARVFPLVGMCASVLLASACGASSLSLTGMEEQLVNRGLAAADCHHSAFVRRRYVYGKAEHKARGVTWCRVRYPGANAWVPFPVQVKHGSLVVLPSRGCHAMFGMVRELGGFGNYMEANGLGVRASCREGRGIGWYLTAGWGRRQRFASDPIQYSTPVGVVGLYTFSRRGLPVIVAQVGIPGTGEPYELFTFKGHKIVPVRMTFPRRDWAGLMGGGAAFHGQGVFCSHRANRLVVTQLYWSGPNPNAPSHHTKDGGTEFNGADKVVANYEQWTFSGQPLVQRSVVALPSKTLTYRRANALENAHCP